MLVAKPEQFAAAAPLPHSPRPNPNPNPNPSPNKQRQQIATPKVLESLSPPSSSCLFAFFWLSLTQQWVVAVAFGAGRGVYVIFDFYCKCIGNLQPRVD